MNAWENADDADRLFIAVAFRQRSEGASNGLELLAQKTGGWAKARSFVVSPGPLPEGNGNERKVRSVQRVNELFNYQRAPNTNEPDGPRTIRLPQDISRTNTKVRDTLNFPVLA